MIGRRLAAAAAILGSVGLAAAPQPAHALGTGAAVGIGLGAFALGTALAAPYYYQPAPYYGYPAYYGAPGLTVPDAQAMNAAAQQPLTFTTSAWQNPVNACPYDLDHNGKVGLSDLLIFAAAYNATPSSGNWNPAADFDADNKIGLGDLLLFAAHYNRIASGCPP